jgi:hypothetical protein
MYLDNNNIISRLLLYKCPKYSKITCGFSLVVQSGLGPRTGGDPSIPNTGRQFKETYRPEEEDLVKHLLNLDSRGFGPKLHEVAAMANYLLANRGGTPVGIGWPGSFINRKPELKMRFSRKYDYQRAKCEDPRVIAPWFELVRNTISKYGITDKDIYNFDETGFQMGVISTAKVVTGSERRAAPKAVQPCNREWVTCSSRWDRFRVIAN